MKITYTLIVVLLCALTALSQSRYIAVLNDGADQETTVRKFPRDVQVTGRVKDTLNAVFVNTGHNGASALRRLSSVKYVVLDTQVELYETQDNVGWPLAMVDKRSITYPWPTTYTYNQTGRGVTVYIIDTGILTTHPDFGGRAREGFTVVKGKSGIPCSSHGTGVASVVGGTIHGVAKQVNLVSVRVFQCGQNAYVSDVIKGMNYVARQRGVRIANLSLGGSYNTAMNDAVRTLVEDGVTVVVAAGNSGVNACTFSPASAPLAITVSGVRQDGYDDGFNSGIEFSGFNYGPCVDIFAPMSGWLALYDQNGNPSDGWIGGGTSFSAPYVTGAAALYLETNPNATPQQVTNAIMSNATYGMLHINGVGSPNIFVNTLF